MIEAIIGAVWPYVLGTLALVAGWFAARQSGKVAGRTAAKIDQLEADASAREKAREAAAKIDRLDDAAVRDLARQRMRDNARR